MNWDLAIAFWVLGMVVGVLSFFGDVLLFTKNPDLRKLGLKILFIYLIIITLVSLAMGYFFK